MEHIPFLACFRSATVYILYELFVTYYSLTIPPSINFSSGSFIPAYLYHRCSLQFFISKMHRHLSLLGLPTNRLITLFYWNFHRGVRGREYDSPIGKNAPWIYLFISLYTFRSKLLDKCLLSSNYFFAEPYIFSRKYRQTSRRYYRLNYYLTAVYSCCWEWKGYCVYIFAYRFHELSCERRKSSCLLS